MSSVAFMVGALVGSFIWVRLFMFLAGARFSNVRQIVAAYTAFAIAGAFIAAVGNANGGPPNFSTVPLHLVATALVMVGEIVLLSMRKPA